MDLHPRLIGLALAFALATIPAQATESAQPLPLYSPQKVVYDIGDAAPTRWDTALRNLENHLAVVGPQHLQAIVVIHGNGVSMLTAAGHDATLAHRLSALAARGVHFIVSAHALTAAHVAGADLGPLGQVTVVPSGALAIARAESAGYCYLNP